MRAIVRRRAALSGVAAFVVSLAATGSAAATFPNFSDCPRTTPNITSCMDIVSQSGDIVIKGFDVPLDHSLEIRGALTSTGSTADFVPATGTNGFFATPVDVPGGLLGISLPIPGNAVTATAELAGPASAIRISLSDFSISLPIKLRLMNPLIGPGCQIGTNSNPANLHLILGTTNPPPPNTPISGHIGTITGYGTYILYAGFRHVDNSFAVPGASGCGIGLGLINALIDAKLQLPSAPGNNTMQIYNDIALGGL
jgi:hypothetical protein